MRVWVTRLAQLAAFLGVLGACGPAIPLDTGLKTAGADVFYGVPQPTPAPPPALPPLANPNPYFPVPVEQPPITCVASTCNLPPACPDASPVAYPAVPATDSATVPPKPGTYEFRHAIAITTTVPGGGSVTRKANVNWPRSVTKVVVNSDGSYQFDVVDDITFIDQKTTTTYRVLPNGQAPTVVQGQTPTAGIYIASITTVDPSGTSTFNPGNSASPGVETFPFPAAPGTAFAGAGTDPLTQQAMEFDAGTQVNGDKRINACGTVLDSWDTSLVGHIANAFGGTNTAMTFNETIDVATQFGGLIIADHLIEDFTTQNGTMIHEDIASTINVKPNQ